MYIETSGQWKMIKPIPAVGRDCTKGFKLSDTNKVGRWEDKVYTKQIIEYVKQSLRPDEKNAYDVIFNALADQFEIKDPNELMILDLAVNDYLSVKRLHLLLKDQSDIVNIKTRSGQVVRKAHEAGYLINAIEGQFRQNMKELLLTPKERIKKTIGLQPKDLLMLLARQLMLIMRR